MGISPQTLVGAVEDAVDGLVEGGGVALVFFGDFAEGGADEFLAGVVAVEAIGPADGGEAGSFFGEGGEGDDGGGKGGVVFLGVAVFLVLDVELVGEGLAGGEEGAVAGLGEDEGGRVVSGGDGVGGAVGGTGGVGDFEGDGVVAGFAEGEGGFHFGGKFLVAVGPGVGEFFALGVAGGGGVELDFQREGAVFFVGGEAGEGFEVAVAVGDVEEFGVFVGVPGGAVVEEPEGAVGGEESIGGAFDFDGEGEVFDGGEFFVFIEAGPFEEGSVPVPEEEAVVVVGGEAVGFFKVGLVVENGTGAGSAAAFFQLGEFFGIGVGVVDEGGLGGREFFFSGVERGVVDGFGGVEFFANFAIGEIDEGVGLVVGDEVGPAEEAGLAGLVDLIVSTWAAWAVATGIGADVAPVEVAGFGVDGKFPRVAAAHDVDFRAGAGGAFGEEVAFRDGVGGVGLDFDADESAAKVVGVGGGFFGVPGFASGAAVDGGVGGGIAKRVGVVTGGGVEESVGAELEHAAVVAALAALGGPLDDFFFRR